ncbi:uncharacterized protein LOC144121926 [Amblyomma americanum]|uniref:Uncharacterized protein n=1 Tax=Amblyomma americanum TaxID=6943 RepID=A0AAQ4F0B0_AMBAM
MSGYTHSDRCDVYLCSTPIMQRDLGGSALNVLSFFASTSRSVCGESWEKHWLLVFDYGEDEVLICDADMDHAGDLTGRRYWKKRAAFEATYPYKRHLGKHWISEKRIEEVMKKMCDSGPYHLTANNCQKWAQDFLRQFGIDMPAEEHDAEKVVCDVVQPLAIGGAVLLGVGVLGALIFGAGARRNNRD